MTVVTCPGCGALVGEWHYPACTRNNALLLDKRFSGDRTADMANTVRYELPAEIRQLREQRDELAMMVQDGLKILKAEGTSDALVVWRSRLEKWLDRHRRVEDVG